MSDEHVPQRDEAGNESWNITLFDLTAVPNQALDVAPSLLGGRMPQQYLDYRALEGRDIIDILVRGDIQVGAHDRATADWAARNLDRDTLLTLLSWVRRAAASGST